MWQFTKSPAIARKRGGYRYIAVSERWRKFCAQIPCNVFIDWGDYATDSIRATIRGEEVVIQCWKGKCQRFLGGELGPWVFPGGIGGEVGIYSYNDQWPWDGSPAIGREHDMIEPPEWHVDFGAAWDSFVQRFHRHAKSANPLRTWMPAVDLVKKSGKPITFSLYDPRYAEPLIDRFSTRSYWTCQWLDLKSYAKWLQTQAGRKTGGQRKQVNPDRYRMEFEVDGQHFVWSGTSGIRRVHPKKMMRRDLVR